VPLWTDATQSEPSRMIVAFTGAFRERGEEIAELAKR
jgi:hypothetical protein